MADRLKEILREATDSVHVIWPEAAEIRRRADRRRITLRAFAVAVAVIAVATTLRVTVFQPASAPPPQLDTRPTPCAGLDLSMPQSESEVKVVITARGERYGPIEQAFKDRGFIVAQSFSQQEPPEGLTVIRYGASEVGDAWLVYAYFLREAHIEFEPALRTGAVDIIIGREFKQLATPSEARRMIAALGRPPEPVC